MYKWKGILWLSPYDHVNYDGLNTYSSSAYSHNKNEHIIRSSLIKDIKKKYSLPNSSSYCLNRYNTNILRELLIFSEHEYIVNKIKAHYTGSF